MPMSNYIEALAAGHYAFIDLGSGSGGSIDHCARRFALGSGLGFELDAKEIAEARQAGFDVVQADLMSVEAPPGSVAFVSAMDFLEHLPDADAAALVLKRFSPAAREFIFIRHPSFEEMEYLAGLGLKLCWTDWSGHPNMMRIDDFEKLFEHFGWTEYTIVPRNLVANSTDDQLVPLSAPTDTVMYDPSSHESKPFVRFDRPIFGQYDILVRRNGGLTDEEWERFLLTDIAAGGPAWASRRISPRPAIPASVQGEFGFYDSKTSRWTIRTGDGNEKALIYGGAGQGFLPLIGNFSGNGSGLGLYDPATGYFFLKHTIDQGLADVTVGFGPKGSLPIAGDWTGLGSDKIGVYVPTTGQWFLRYENSDGPADESFSFGPANTGCLPFAGDWDGDGRDSVGLYDPESGLWHLRRGSADGLSDNSFTFCPAGGHPVVGDWDGDGRDSIGVYIPDWGTWILRNTNSNGPADATFIYHGAGAPIALPFS